MNALLLLLIAALFTARGQDYSLSPSIFQNPGVNQKAIYRLTLNKVNQKIANFASGTKITTTFPPSLPV